MLILLALFVLEPAFLCGMAFAFNKGETKSFGTGILAALAIPVATLFLTIVWRALGPPGVGYVQVLFYPMAAFLVLWAVFDCKPSWALLGSLIMLIYKTVFWLIFETVAI